MKWMVKLYDKALLWSQHKHAPYYLAAITFLDASVFPIPPYFMFAPMVLARPNKAAYYAWLTTIASVVGGLLGYVLGYFVFKPVMLPLIDYFGYGATYANVTKMFNEYGIIALLLLGLAPIPYKIVAITAGFLQVSLPVFFITSLISKGIKFYAIAYLIIFSLKVI